MTGLKIALLAGVGAMVAGLAPGSANAITISGGSAALSATLTDYNQALSGNLTKFNSNLGTLNSITFTVGYGFNSTITVTATTASSGSVRTESAAQFSSADSAINAVLNSLVNTTAAIIGAQTLNPAAYDLLGNNNIYSIGAAGSQNYTSSASASNVYSSTAAGNLAAFSSAGGGAITVLGKTLTGTIIQQTGGNASATQTTLANQNISIQYDYTAAVVPEPASLALLGAGLIGLGLVRRRG